MPLVNELDRLQRSFEKAEDRFKNVATGLRVTALQEVPVTVDGEELVLTLGKPCERLGGRPRDALRVADALDIEILPGGQTLASLGSAVTTARKDLEYALARVGVADVLLAARAQLDEQARTTSLEVRRNADLLDSFSAPEGWRPWGRPWSHDIRACEAAARRARPRNGGDGRRAGRRSATRSPICTRWGAAAPRPARASALEVHDEQRTAYASARSRAETALEGARRDDVRRPGAQRTRRARGRDTTIVLALQEGPV